MPLEKRQRPGRGDQDQRRWLLRVPTGMESSLTPGPVQSSCPRCSSVVVQAVFFCPRCGAAQLESILSKTTTTTAHYDPSAPDFKPWRETPASLSAKKQPTLPPSTVAALQQKPSWKPPMKQPAKDHDAAKSVKKSKKKVSDAAPEGSTATADTAGGSAVSSTTASRLPAPAHGVVYFKQLAFQRRGGRRMIAPSKRRVEAAAAAAATAAAAAAATAGQYNRGDELTLVHPLAVYEATWLNIPGYTIHISLVDRSLGGDASRFFLRVGVVLEPAHGGTDELEVLEVVQNDAGKLLTPPLQCQRQQRRLQQPW